MNLVESYAVVRRSIVAFCQRYHAVDESGTPPAFPFIIGTGFVAREDGVIVTNDHVVRAFGKVPKPKDAAPDDWGVEATLLHLTDLGMIQIPLPVLGVAVISKFVPSRYYYGPNKPDVALVHVKGRGLPALEVDITAPVEGMELGTAGFPMGRDVLTAPGWLHQVTPTLQKGIVSAVLPFACAAPHGFTINVMTQGGASGSPVFNPDSAKIVGVLYGGLNDIGVTANKDVYRVPTNISYVVPSHFIADVIKQFATPETFAQPEDAQTIEEMIASSDLVNVFDHDIADRYVIKESARLPAPDENDDT